MNEQDFFEALEELEADLFALAIEEKAAELEVTVDYYLMEFV
jgi:hypothetical protein